MHFLAVFFFQSQDGKTSVVITGTGFTGVTTVKFGNNNANSFTVDSDTQITAISPAGSAGKVDVTVATPYDISATSTSDQFTYQLAPTLDHYYYNNNNILEVYGRNFSALGGNVTAMIDNHSVEVSFISSTQLDISITPYPSSKTIVVTNGDCQFVSGEIGGV